jgi:tellurite resistance protein TerC
MTDVGIGFWIGFNLFILTALGVDLYLFQRRPHVIRSKESLAWTAVWITFTLIFCITLYFWQSPMAALTFLTGYLIEFSLSMDNLFVFLMIFKYFAVPEKYIPRVLLWGILGALIMRAIFIFAGILLIQQFHFIIYIFGGLLLLTGIKLALEEDHEVHPENNLGLKLIRKIMPITKDYHDTHFFIRHSGKLMATPLFVVLLVIETTDLIFAIDSVPAVLAITQDPFLVYTANAFAILGLRALYFALAHLIEQFHYFHYGLAVLLSFIGIKMLTSDFLYIPIWLTLVVTVSILAISVIASILHPKKEIKIKKENKIPPENTENIEK